ncbi:MAG: membrane protein insertase YidC [Planctomycetaceae bacterium]|nr:membrane protein insertase YidC [Planctomycetaceae bacterium]
MEKRLPIALLLCFAVLAVWSYLNPPAKNESRRVLDGQGTQVEGTVGADGAATEPPSLVPPPPVEDAPVVEEQLEFGVQGEPGHFLATFTNRGAKLLELRTGTHLAPRQPDEAGKAGYYWAERAFDAEQRRDPANWATLLTSVLAADGPTGTFAMFTGPSARDVALRPLDTSVWSSEVERDDAGAPLAIRFRLDGGGGVVFSKRIAPVPGTWEFDVTLGLERLADAPANLRGGARTFRLRPAGVMPAELRDSFYPEPRAVAVGPATSTSPSLASALVKPGARDLTGTLDVRAPLSLVGSHNKYFAALLRGGTPDAVATLTSASYRRVSDRAQPGLLGTEPLFVEAEAELSLNVPDAPGLREWNYRFYVGPKDHELFHQESPANAAIVDADLSWFSSIGSLLLDILALFEGLTGNWGIAIILLTVLVRTLLFPLNRRSQTAMARYATKMKRLQPRIEALKKQYEGDPKKLQAEQAKLMQEEGAFPPLGGCLPIFLQLPVFFGLFSALRTSFDLRQAPFAGWIVDLSRPDNLFYLGWNVPFIDLEWFNLLPILMVVLWIWQQKTMPTPTDEQARRMQRIMLFMPVVMGVFLYNYAAGLSLYMMTQSALGIFEQKVIKKFWPVDEKEQPKKPGAGCAPMARAMEKAAERQKQLEKARQHQKTPPRKKGR